MKLVQVAAGTVTAPARAPLEARLAAIHAGLQEVVATHAPESVAVEDLHARHVKAALALGHARGVALLVAAQAGLSVEPYAPALVRRAVVGRGGADKGQVARIVGALLGLRELPALDATDALAVAITHLRRVELPAPARAR